VWGTGSVEKQQKVISIGDNRDNNSWMQSSGKGCKVNGCEEIIFLATVIFQEAILENYFQALSARSCCRNIAAIVCRLTPNVSKELDK
jgi:hypothetical protein